LTELELVALWTVLCVAGLRLAVWLLLFIAVHTGSLEVTVAVRPGQRFKKPAVNGNGAANGNGGKTAPKAEDPAPEGTGNG
jgi:hypothetical protein